MIIMKVSIISGVKNAMNLPVTEEQLNEWKNGKLIQNAMPNLTPTQREFLITGMSEAEQKKFFGK
jgi:hypothetical protein